MSNKQTPDRARRLPKATPITNLFYLNPYVPGKNTLKLCTCNTNANRLRNYWVYNLIKPGKNNFIVGEICAMPGLEKSVSVSNKKRITRLLNTGKAFDFEIASQEKDELYLYFTTGVSNSHSQITYSFAFTKGKWCSIPYDSMMIDCYHETLLKGEIQNGLPATWKKMI